MRTRSQTRADAAAADAPALTDDESVASNDSDAAPGAAPGAFPGAFPRPRRRTRLPRPGELVSESDDDDSDGETLGSEDSTRSPSESSTDLSGFIDDDDDPEALEAASEDDTDPDDI